MKIISTIKDYYDYVAHIYGGGDPTIKYVRLPFTAVSGDSYWHSRDAFDVPISKPMFDHRYINNYKKEYEYNHLKWLSICGNRYLLVQEIHLGDWCVADKNKHPKLWKAFTRRSLWNPDNNTSPTDYIGAPEKELILISRKLKAPVFTYTVFDGYVSVGDKIPILKDMGIDKLIPPEQLYQDISYFVGNIMHESPDMMPPTKMTDREKIQQHGFDLRQSFRHRN